MTLAFLFFIASGMGLAVTKDLLSKGWRVCLVDKQPLPSSEEGDLLSGDNTIFQTADISNYDELAATFQATWSKWAQLDFGKSTSFPPPKFE